MDITGNTILITGAATGIGLEAAKLFDQHGNRLIMVARNEDRLEREAARLKDAHTFACDISDADQVGRLVDYVRSEHGEINMIFLNAGVTNNYQLFGDEDMFEHASEEMATNYLSAVRLTQLFEPLLRDKPNAAIIITTSGVALVPDVQNPTYSATKAALHSLVLAMRLVLQKTGSDIKVFELMAPLVDTPFSKDVNSDAKVPPAEVADALLTNLEQDVLEMHVGITADMYQTYLKSLEQALRELNTVTGG
jgi:uncharacterized oxidoreductase